MTTTSSTGPTTAWLSEEEQRSWRAYLLGSALLAERLDAELRTFGLDLAEYEILVALSESPERRIRMAELAAQVHQSRSRLTHTISRLERAGLVRRTSCPTDRRGVWAELDARGLRLLEAAAPAHVTSVRRLLLDAMTAEDFEALGRAFAGVTAACQQ